MGAGCCHVGQQEDSELPLIAPDRAGGLAAESSGSLADLSAMLLPWLFVVASALQLLQDPVAQDQLLEEPDRGFDPSVVHLDFERAVPGPIVGPRAPTRLISSIITCHGPSVSTCRLHAACGPVSQTHNAAEPSSRGVFRKRGRNRQNRKPTYHSRFRAPCQGHSVDTKPHAQPVLAPSWIIMYKRSRSRHLWRRTIPCRLRGSDNM